MKKKATKKSEPVAVAEVVEQAVANIAAQAEPSVAEQPRKRKMVEFKCLSAIFEFATEKAQLLLLHTDDGQEVKFWLSKQLLHAIADGDEPGMMICRLPAWLYYKTGLNNYFPVARWSSEAV